VISEPAGKTTNVTALIYVAPFIPRAGDPMLAAAFGQKIANAVPRNIRKDVVAM
jgi:hypothetical protein